MRCIFCLEERPGSEEHVFPLAIGGRLTTDRVCEPCNSSLGSRVDSALSDNFLIRMRRAELGLAGNSGTAPALHEMLEGVSRIVGRPGRAQTKFNRKTGKLELKSLYHSEDLRREDGTKIRQIIIDQKDQAEIPKIIQRERRRHGLSPLSDSELAAEVARASAGVFTVQNPVLNFDLTISFAFLRQAMLKICYELAFLWLGEKYLDDPFADRIRKAILTPEIDAADKIFGFVGDPADCPPFSQHWTSSKTHHVAWAAAPSRENIMMAVRIFDIYAAVFPITENAANHLRNEKDVREKLRFLTLDSVSPTVHDVSFQDEVMRMGFLMRNEKRLPPFPDPLPETRPSAQA